MTNKKIQHEITFEEVFVTLLKQYRHGVILCILCFAAVFLYLQVAVLPNAKKPVTITEETKQNIMEYIEKKTLLSEAADYMENSVLMSCDPYEVGYSNLVFSVAGQEMTPTLWNRCMNPLEEPSFQDELMAIFSEVNHMKYLREAVTCTDISYQAVGNEKILQIQIVCPDPEKHQDIADAVSNYVHSIFENTTCQVQALQNNYFVQVNHELLSLQSQRNVISSLTAELDKMLLNMSPTEQFALEQYSEGQLPDNIIIHEAIKQYPYYFLALILSILTYMCYEIMKLSWSAKIQNVYILENELDLDILCEVGKRKIRNPIDKMIEKIKKRLWKVEYPFFEESALFEELPHHIDCLEDTVFVITGEALKKKSAQIFPFSGEKGKIYDNCKLLPYTKQLDLSNISKIVLLAQYNDSYFEDIVYLRKKCESNHTAISGVVFFR